MTFSIKKPVLLKGVSYKVSVEMPYTFNSLDGEQITKQVGKFTEMLKDHLNKGFYNGEIVITKIEGQGV